MIKLNPAYRSDFDRDSLTRLYRQNGFVGKVPSPKTLPKQAASKPKCKNPAAPKQKKRKRLSKSQSNRSACPETQFLDEIHGTRLLSIEEERKLTQKIFRIRKAFNRLILKEPEVIQHIAELLSGWESRKVRLDFVCNVALSETSKRKILEPAIIAAIPKLKRLPERIRRAESSSTAKFDSQHQQNRLHRITVALVESLAIRPRTFESSPFVNPKAKELFAQYRLLCKQLTQSNLRLVIKVARKICGNSDRLMDAIQDGTEGLMHAVTKFDHTRKLRFSTYAIPWIRQTIFAALPNSQRLIRVPQTFRSVTKKIESAIEEMQIECESTRNDSGNIVHKIANRMNLDSKVVIKHIVLRRDAQSLNQPNESDSSSTTLDLLETSQPNPRVLTQEQERREQIQSVLLSSLTRSEQRVIRLRYGLDDGRFRTFAEVGEIVGVTRERVRQIEKPALEKLRNLKTMAALNDQ